MKDYGDNINISKVITTLLICAIVYLFTSIITLTDSINELNSEIKLIKQYNRMSNVDWEKMSDILDANIKVLNAMSERIRILEYKTGDKR